MISDRSVRSGRIFAVLGLLLLGCGPAATPETDPTTDIDYLRGVDSAHSVRLTTLGDTKILGPDSAMQEALVAGDEELLVAATVFRHGADFTLDLIVINHSELPVSIDRASLHLVDAEGRWLTPIRDWDGAHRYGLRGNQNPDGPVMVYELPEQELEFDQSMALEASRSVPQARPTKSEPPPDRRRRRNQADDYDDLTTADLDAPLSTPRGVRVRPGASRAFWTYFEGQDIEYPITAVVMLEEHQLLFHYER